jgi:hypothetical protein
MIYRGLVRMRTDPVQVKILNPWKSALVGG